MGTTKNSRRIGILGALALATVASACSTVSPDELDTSLAALRGEMLEEMQAGDQAVSQQLGNRLAAVERRMGELESDLQQMESDFQVAIQRLEDNLRFDVPVYFAFDDATVETEDEAVLNRFGSVAQEYYPGALVTVEGFTDAAGPAEYNLHLGQLRADAVARYLVASAGFAPDRVRAVSYGEDTKRLVRPDGWGPGQAGWENRRVVLVIDHQGMPPAMPTVTQDSEGSGS
jgi:peptidoglycan-associated lipoprotein